MEIPTLCFLREGFLETAWINPPVRYRQHKGNITWLLCPDVEFGGHHGVLVIVQSLGKKRGFFYGPGFEQVCRMTFPGEWIEVLHI